MGQFVSSPGGHSPENPNRDTLVREKWRSFFVTVIRHREDTGDRMDNHRTVETEPASAVG